MPNPVFFRKKSCNNSAHYDYFFPYFMNNRVNYVNYCPNHEKFLRIMIISFLFMNNYVNYVYFCSRKPFFETLIILNSNYFTLFS